MTYINRLSEIKCPNCEVPFDIMTIDINVRYAADNEYSQSYDMKIQCEKCKAIWFEAEEQE